MIKPIDISQINTDNEVDLEELKKEPCPNCSYLLGQD